jgi:hypothetical protein
LSESEREIAENSQIILDFISDYIFQKHKLPSKTVLVEETGITTPKLNEALTRLVDTKELNIVFGGEGKTGVPEIYLPKLMLQSIIMTQPKPDWISSYSFAERTAVDTEIKTLQEKVLQYDMFERLLYLADIPLEAAIAFTLVWLEFENVEHHIKNRDYADVTFEYNGVKALVEVEGTTKQGDKVKALQLDGWMKAEVAKDEREPDKLQGFFFVNHFREKDPITRDKPITDHARKFLQLDNSRLVTTKFLFETVKSVLSGEISKDEAKCMIWDGEPLN